MLHAATMTPMGASRISQAQRSGFNSCCTEASPSQAARATPLFKQARSAVLTPQTAQHVRHTQRLTPMPCLGSSTPYLNDAQQQASVNAQCSEPGTPTPSTTAPSGLPLPALPLPAGFAEALVQTGTFLAGVLLKLRTAVASVFPQIDSITAEDVHVQLRKLKMNASLLAIVAPLARAGGSESLTALYARTFERAAFGFAKMYLFCLFMRVLLSWFPEIDWNAQPWTFLRLITEPYLQIYRGILPPLFGQLDFTPLFGFLILQDVVEVMAPTFTMGLHDHDTSTRWTTSDVMCYFDGF